jgi:hypothetical protein
VDSDERHDLDRFTAAYAETALWDSIDQAGTRLDQYGVGFLAPQTVRQMRSDCADFRLRAGDAGDRFDPGDVAHDFWLERNQRRFGGFWDGDYPQPAATVLAAIAASAPASCTSATTA